MLELDRAIADVAAASGWTKNHSAVDLEGAWRSFVAQCRNGYDMNIYEYENDRSVRALIQVVINDERAQAADGFLEFRSKIEKIDADFRGLLQDGTEVGEPGDPWWERGVLKEAGAELSGDFMSLFGVRIGIV